MIRRRRPRPGIAAAVVALAVASAASAQPGMRATGPRASFAELPAPATPARSPTEPRAPTAPARASTDPPPPLLGRLFFDADERRRIDAGALPDARRAPAGAAPTANAPMRIDGTMRRADGLEQVWVDGAPLAAGDALDGARIRAGAEAGTVRVHRPGEPPRTLRVGQHEGATELGDGNRVEISR